MDSELKITEWRFKELLRREDQCLKLIPRVLQLMITALQNEDEKAANDIAYAAKIVTERAREEIGISSWVSNWKEEGDKITYLFDHMDAYQRGSFTVLPKENQA